MLAMTADGRRIYTANIADGTVSEIDVPGRKFMREYTVAPQVEGIAVSPGGEQVWVGSNKSNTVTILDPKAGAIAGNHRLPSTQTRADFDTIRSLHSKLNFPNCDAILRRNDLDLARRFIATQVYRGDRYRQHVTAMIQREIDLGIHPRN